MRIIILLLASLLFAPSLWAEDRFVPDEKIPSDLKPLITPGSKLLAYESADLNRDGLKDYVFILEKQKTAENPDEIEVGQRPLKIALRLRDGSLREVKVNERMVFCSTCGGVYGDPFNGLEAKDGSFSVSHYGGSGWRWGNTFQFNYSRIDQTWQLVMVEEFSFHGADPNTMKKKRYRPPKDYGKIDIADFDPENFKAVSKK